MHRRTLFLLPLALALAATSPARAQTLLERLAGSSISTSTFVQIAAISDNFEIESARLLLARSQHPKIRAYAMRMIEEHSMMSSEMLALPEATARMPATPPC
jgi:putative membrane protein